MRCPYKLVVLRWMNFHLKSSVDNFDAGSAIHITIECFSIRDLREND